MCIKYTSASSWAHSSAFCVFALKKGFKFDWKAIRHHPSNMLKGMLWYGIYSDSVLNDDTEIFIFHLSILPLHSKYFMLDVTRNKT